MQVKYYIFKQINALNQLFSSWIQNISMKINQDRYQTQFRVRNCKEEWTCDLNFRILNFVVYQY